MMTNPEPYQTGWTIFLIGFGLILCATVAVIGMVVVGGRWAYRLGWSVLAGGGLLAVIRPVDTAWWVAFVMTIGVAIVFTGVASSIRRLPAAAGPGERAVLVPLTLIAVPALIGLSGAGPRWAALVVAISAPVFAFAYSRVIFGGLVGVRVVWPILAVVTAFFFDLPWAVLPGLLGVGVSILAWHPSVKAAFHPPREVGSTFPIPPELAPTEILDAARVDDRGRPK